VGFGTRGIPLGTKKVGEFIGMPRTPEKTLNSGLVKRTLPKETGTTFYYSMVYNCEQVKTRFPKNIGESPKKKKG
jgi:hypothetical protein